MSHQKQKNKVHTLPPPPPPSPPQKFRVGDLLWCRENKKRYTLWWPAMVTYEPNQAILSRTTSRGIPQVHVQYFGISAVRGWVSHLQFEPLDDVTSRKLPISNLGKRMKCEFDVAIQEAAEALKMNHKERKLKFIFNFDPPPSPSQESTVARGGEMTGEDHTLRKGVTVLKMDTDSTKPESTREDGTALQFKKVGKRRGRRRSSTRCTRPVQGRGESGSLSPRAPTTQHRVHRNRRRRERERDLVVSVNMSGLVGTPSGSTPSLLVGQSPVRMDSFAVPVNTVLNTAGREEHTTLNGAVDGHRRPKRVSAKRNFRHAPSLGEKKQREEPLSCPPPVKRLALDPGSESGSETSGMSIASAILTPPPSSGTEAVMDDDQAGSTSGEGSVTASTTDPGEMVEREKQFRGTVRRLGRKLKKNATQEKPAMEGPVFQDGDCAICDASDTNLLACQGHCFQAFHVDCLGLVQPPNFQFVCDECQVVSKLCYVCSKSTGTLERCAKPKCSKFYHRSCIQGNSLFVFDSLKTKFTCPLHSCAKCVCSDLDTTVAPRGSTLVQCVKCPLALHKPHCLIAGCNMLSASQMVCYLHIHIESELNLYKHLNMDNCCECGESGSLYCCDFCSSAYHKECLEEHQKPVEMEGEGERKGESGKVLEVTQSVEKWICPACMDHDLPTYESVVLCKFGVWRWWPGQVVPKDDIPDNIRKKKPGEGMFVVRFCGTRDYCWIHHGRTLSLSLEPGADPAKEVNKMCRSHGKKSANTDKIFKRACEEAMELYMEQMKLQEERKPLPKQESRAYTKIKINKYLVPRPTISDEDLQSLPCQCTPKSPCDDNSICVNRAIHVECNPKTCPVGPFCHNQKMRRFQHANTLPFYTGTRGWGLRAASDINEGDFVVEYVGEVLDMKMVHERLRRAHETQTQHFYMLTLDSRNGLVIDAKEKSNHARFINHSCDPNCETQKWTVGHESRVGIFANKFIEAGTELTFDYQLDSLGNGKKPCLCGSSNCSGFIGVRSKVESKPKPKPKLKKKPKPATVQKPHLPPADIPPVEVTHDNDCFLCGDGGDLLCCDFGKCRKVYHLHCLGRKMVPPEKWVCPHHYCTMCSKRAFVFCSTCPTSYCGKHRKDKLVEVNGQQLCASCCNNTSSHEVENDESTTMAAVCQIAIPQTAPSPISSPTIFPATVSHPTPLSPPVPPPPPPPPSFSPTPSSLPSLPSLSSMHPLSSVPLLSHTLTRHPLHGLSHQPIQLLVPPSNHLFYFNPAQHFLSSSPPSSSLMYPPTYHH